MAGRWDIVVLLITPLPGVDTDRIAKSVPSGKKAVPPKAIA